MEQNVDEIDLNSISFDFSDGSLEASSDETEAQIADERMLALVVDCRPDQQSSAIQDGLKSFDTRGFFYKPLYVASAEEASGPFSTGNVRCIFYFVEDKSILFKQLSLMFEENVAPIPALQFVICDDPSPQLMTDIYEYGLEQFLPTKSWLVEMEAKLADIGKILSTDTSPELVLIELTAAIKSGNQAQIKKCAQKLATSSKFDYLAAYGEGKALQAAGDFQGAVDAFRLSRNNNKLFRSAASSLGENLVVTGHVDEAITVFEGLERLNKKDANRKAILATAWDVKGDKEKAAEYYNAAKLLDPFHQKVLEAEAQLLLSSGKIAEAIQKMDNLRNAGPLFAARLNELGIKLSQAGKGKSALALYSKAHKAVRPELKFKISMNAALACHRMEEYGMGIKYIERCEKEAGGPTDKTSKIKRVLTASLSVKKPAA